MDELALEEYPEWVDELVLDDEPDPGDETEADDDRDAANPNLIPVTDERSPSKFATIPRDESLSPMNKTFILAGNANDPLPSMISAGSGMT
ncbi:MAG: hypothetical protein EOO05_21940 [Chitinophagaceae bacterium]|nr:MAG: hypothetical protein EOO05_21940 [Chitinophagaceae bacterium]